MFTLQLVAQQPPPGNPFDRPEILWATAGIAAALVVGAVVVLWVDRWRKKGLTPESGRSVDELTEYRRLYDAGEITEEEYKKLRAQLADRVKQAAAAAAPNAEAPPQLVNGLPRVTPKPADPPRTESDPPA